MVEQHPAGTYKPQDVSRESVVGVESDGNIELLQQEPLRGTKPDFDEFTLGGPPIMGGSERVQDQPSVEVNPNGLRTLDEIAEVTGYHPGHLRRLLKSGAVAGMKVGKEPRGIWVTTEEAVRQYQEGGNKMGGPRGPRDSSNS